METQAYLELVSGRKGAAALKAWVEFTGWPEEHCTRIPVEERIQRARINASRTLDPKK